MWDFLSGNTHIDGTGLQLKFTAFQLGGIGVQEAPGPFFNDTYYPDRAIFQNNTGFGRTEFRHRFSERQQEIRFSFWFRIRRDFGTFNTDSEFLIGKQLSGSDNPKKFSLGVKPNGSINFALATAGAIGFENVNSSNARRTIVWESSAGLAVEDVWNHYEVYIDLTGTGFYLRQDGNVIANEPTLTTNSTGYGFGTGIDEIAWCWEKFGTDGYDWSSFAVQRYSPARAASFDWYGPSRVTSAFPSRVEAEADLYIDSPTSIIPFYSGSNPFFGNEPTYAGVISEHHQVPRASAQTYPDGDESYLGILANSTAEAYFGFPRWYPVGAIQALQLNLVVKNLSTDSGPAGNAYLYPLYRYGSSIAYGSPLTVPGAGSPAYKNYAFLLVRDPINNLPWSEVDFVDGLWTFGFKIVTPPAAACRIGQICIERLHLIENNIGSEYSIR